MKNLIILALLVCLGYLYFKQSDNRKLVTASLSDSMMNVVDTNELVKEVKRVYVEQTDAEIITDLPINNKPIYDVDSLSYFTANVFLKVGDKVFVVMQVSDDQNKLLLKHNYNQKYDKSIGKWVSTDQGDPYADLYTYDTSSKDLILQFHNKEAIYSPKFNATMDSITCIRGLKNPNGIGTSDLPFALKIKE